MMKRILTVLSLLIALTFALYASEVVSTKTFTANLDLTGEDDIEFYFAPDSGSTQRIEELYLNSSDDKYPIVAGVGAVNICWNVVSSYRFSLTISSEVMKTEKGVSLDWTAKTSSGDIKISKDNGYGSYDDTNIIYTHDPESFIGNVGQEKLLIETSDLSGKPYDQFKTKMIIEVKTE